ncbi:50S ribosomal protein L35ae [Candidatus Woesearchaeota archaeon]|nr:50S ribosomal protein L35ae [Candidatus Woesearchaeota archaeon]
MEGVIVNFRGGKHTKYDNHMIIQISSVKDRENAKKLVGKTVVWKSPAGKEIKGKVSNMHGNSGCIRAIFEKGMPGQAISQKVMVG